MADELSEDAKRLIRQYMLTLVALPATVLTIISGLAGYLLHDIVSAKAYQTAYVEAFNKSENVVLETTAAAIKASTRVSDLEQRMREDMDKITKRGQAVEKLGPRFIG